jgi:hypothetical protein
MSTRSLACAALFLALVLAGCQREEPGPTPVPIKGTVKYNGKPLKAGSVYLVVPGEPPTVLPVTGGAFEGLALPGTRRVEFRAYRTVLQKNDPTDPKDEGIEFVINDLPERYGTTSKLTAEITPTGPNEFAFELVR